MLAPEQLDPIRGTAFLYPCCGDDLETPLRLFGSSVAQFYFVDTLKRRLPSAFHALAAQVGPPLSYETRVFRNRGSDTTYELHRWVRRGEEAFDEIPALGVFFHRGDTLANGEGSSGVPWLGGEWLTRILAKLVRGGLIVSDGSNCPDDGPAEMMKFHCNNTIGGLEAVSLVNGFEFKGREFSCIGYAGNRYGPTLIWRVE